jgi:hypothetical protein
MNRKQRRELERYANKDDVKNLSEKISIFGNLPQQCCACTNAFDKQNKDMIDSWRVVVRQEVVRLFCPDCIQKTQDIINERTETLNQSIQDPD